MIGRIRRRIHNLRQEPEEVRLRAATYMTAVSGAVLALLWLFVLLPLQLHFSGPRGEEPAAQPQAAATPAGDVGGIRQDLTVPSESQQEFHGTRPSVRQFIPVAVSPSPEPTPETAPANPAEQPPAP